MDDELRQAVRDVLDTWDARLQVGMWAVIEEMEDLRAALAKNANTAPQPTREAIFAAVARGWCAKMNEHKTMDADLASAVADEIIKLYGGGNPDLQTIEQYRLQMAGISVAAIGYWKEGDEIHPDYDTPALRDVAKLYAKYDELYKARNAAPDVSTSKTILVGRYIRENGLDSQCFTCPDDLPDGQYEMYLRNLTSDCKTYSEQLPRVCQMQASLDDKRDAERYRFMQGNESIKFWDGLGALHPAEWDDFIDAAMKEKP